MRLRSAMLYVKDLERMKQFYGDMLALKLTNQDWTDVWATFDIETVLDSPYTPFLTRNRQAHRNHVPADFARKGSGETHL
jgi:catechol 2,3-dioxygenase-like lactoylglutathione lyase family enzyme